MQGSLLKESAFYMYNFTLQGHKNQTYTHTKGKYTQIQRKTKALGEVLETRLVIVLKSQHSRHKLFHVARWSTDIIDSVTNSNFVYSFPTSRVSQFLQKLLAFFFSFSQEPGFVALQACAV